MRIILSLAMFAALALALPADAASPTEADAQQIIKVSTKSGPVSKRIVLSADKAAVIDLDVDARDAIVSNPDIVDAVVRTPRRYYLLAKKTGQTNAFFFDTAGHQILSLDIRVEKDVADLASLLKTAMPNSDVQVSALNDNVVLSGNVSSALDSNRAQDLAARFTGDATKVVNMISVKGGEQVMIKVRVAEMNRSIAKQFGIDLSSAMNVNGVPIALGTSNPYGLMGRALSDLSGGSVGSVCAGAFNPKTTSTTTSTLNTANSTTNTITNATTNVNNASTNSQILQPGVAAGVSAIGSAVQTITSGIPAINQVLTTTSPCNSPNNAQGVIKALEQVGLVHMLAEPNLTAISGETAKSQVGGSFPVPTGRDNQGNVTIEFKDFGVGLAFTPIVMSGGRISLQVSTEVSELTSTGAYLAGGTTSTDPTTGQTTTTQGLSIPALSVRRASTTIEVPSGGSFAIAGLMQQNTKQVIDAFPGLKELPVLGALFQSRDFQSNETELVVVVSAYLVQPNAETAFDAPTDGFVPATDIETILLGRLNAVYKRDGAAALKPQAQASVGYIIQ